MLRVDTGIDNRDLHPRARVGQPDLLPGLGHAMQWQRMIQHRLEPAHRMHASDAGNGGQFRGFFVGNFHYESVYDGVHAAQNLRFRRLQPAADRPLLFADRKPSLPRRFAPHAAYTSPPRHVDGHRLARHFNDVPVGDGRRYDQGK